MGDEFESARAATSLEAIQLAVDQLCCDYQHVPAQDLSPRISGWLSHVAALVADCTTLHRRRELLVCAGWLFLIGGCVEYDMGRRVIAERYRRAALGVAEESGHREIAAWAWEMAAWFALTQGRFGDVVAACDAGHAADSSHSVGVQLYSQQAKAFARMGDERLVLATLDAGKTRLERLPQPVHTAHHFVIDPDKWDLYAMDAYRLLGDDERASTHAHEVLRLGRGPDGVEKAPMRGGAFDPGRRGGSRR
jgi:hypothetical protein